MNNNKTITQKALKEAYQLVQADLLATLAKMKDKQSIRLNSIGTFTKKKRTTKVALENSKLYGKTIQYYQITFKTSQTLKRALDK